MSTYDHQFALCCYLTSHWCTYRQRPHASYMHDIAGVRECSIVCAWDGVVGDESM
jgi:hypothetical protein